jgi:hypothetical protein
VGEACENIKSKPRKRLVDGGVEGSEILDFLYSRHRIERLAYDLRFLGG